MPMKRRLYSSLALRQGGDKVRRDLGFFGGLALISDGRNRFFSRIRTAKDEDGIFLQSDFAGSMSRVPAAWVQ